MILFTNNRMIMPTVTLAGEVHVPAPNNHFPRTPSEYILYLVTDGCMKLTEDEVFYTLKAGDVLLLDPSRHHEGVLTMSEVSYMYVHFHFEGFHECSSDVSINEFLINSRLSGDSGHTIILPKYSSLGILGYDSAFTDIKHIIAEMSSYNDCNRALASCIMYKLLISLCREHLTLETRPVNDNNNPVADLLRFLRSNYKKRFSSEDIEKRYNMNYDYLNRLFKQRTGTTIMHYTNSCRIEEAKILLKSGEYNVSGVARHLGFTNEFYFSRAFKQSVGIAPLEYMGRLQKSS